ncbi:MAG: hypothetical protein Q8L57_03575, partial [bacterium]|nr:hypothetical protein [bacterium]
NTPAYTYSPAQGIYTFQIECLTDFDTSISSKITLQVRKPALVLSVGSKTCNLVNLSWAWQDAFQDYLNQVQFYRLFRDGILIADNIPLIQSTYQDRGVFTSGQTYNYRVEAVRSAPPTPVSSINVDSVPCPALPGWQEVIPR